MSEHWPFHPRYLSQRVREDLVSLIIAGMSERLRSPIVIMESRYGIGDNKSREEHFIYPVDKTRKMHRYPEFCRVFNEKVPQGETPASKTVASVGERFCTVELIKERSPCVAIWG